MRFLIKFLFKKNVFISNILFVFMSFYLCFFCYNLYFTQSLITYNNNNIITQNKNNLIIKLIFENENFFCNQKRQKSEHKFQIQSIPV